MALDLSKVRQEVGQTGADLTKPQQGGGDYVPPAEGPTRLRLVGYVETGVHTEGVGPARKTKPRVELTFELSGPKHEAKKLDDGTKIPQRITIREALSTHEKANLIKLFTAMNTDGKAKNFVDMLMEKAWRGTVSHGTSKAGKVFANLRPKGGGFQISATEFEDPETGELRKVSVPPAISEPSLFLWDYADLDQWDSLRDFQKDKIRKAENFEGSAIYLALAEAGRTDEYALSERGAKEAAEAEPPAEEEEADDPPPPPPKKAPAKAAASPAKGSKAPAKGKVATDDSDPLAGLD